MEEDRRAAPHISTPLWKNYAAIGRYLDGRLLVQGPEEAAVERFVQVATAREVPGPEVSPGLDWANPPEAGDMHQERVRRALEAIARGELYQVNLARRFEFSVRGNALSILHALGEMARAPYSMAIDLGGVEVISTSPELFLDYSIDGSVVTRPIKGTRPRGADEAEDERLRDELEASEKERAELAMVVDIERNDLGRIAAPGTVELSVAPHVVSHPTVHHREAEVRARLALGTDREKLIRTMMPSGSVTGAPKVSAMDLIASLEKERRGLYTGALGYTTRSGGLRLSMAIRVLTVRDGEAHYYAGGGIVADSDPAQELSETVWKAEQLRGLVASGWEA